METPGEDQAADERCGDAVRQCQILQIELAPPTETTGEDRAADERCGDVGLQHQGYQHMPSQIFEQDGGYRGGVCHPLPAMQTPIQTLLFPIIDQQPLKAVTRCPGCPVAAGAKL